MKALIFDFDGTILDTERTELEAWQYIYAEYNCTLPLDKWYRKLDSDQNDFEPFSYLEELIKEKLDYEFLTKKRRIKLYELTETLTPLPGIIEWLLKAKTMKLHLAIASSSPRYWVENHLKRFNLLSAFNSVLTREDVMLPKPHPEIYELTLKKLGVNANEAIVIEDSPNGARAAVSAGICCIVVPNTITFHLEFPTVFQKETSLENINLEAILNFI